MANFLTDQGTQNIPSKGRDLYIGSYAVTGGTIYVHSVRSPDGVVAGVSAVFVAAFTAGTTTGADTITTISTVGAGTLTAAAIAGGVVNRTGSVAAYTDTTDTAANLLLQLPTFVQNSSKRILFKNTVNFAETITAGNNVTMAGQTIVPANSVMTALIVRTDANTATPTFTITGLYSSPITVLPFPVATALTTNGAGTVTAAGIVGQFTTRSGISSGTAASDTLDLATNIIAAAIDGVVGQSFVWTYVNNTNAVMTILTNTGVTLTGSVVIPPGNSAEFLVTIATGTTVTVQGLGVFGNESVPVVVATSYASGTGTAAAGAMTGAGLVVLTTSGQTAAITLTTRTAALLIADHPNSALGQTWVVRIVNANYLAPTTAAAGGAPVTLVGGTGVNSAGTIGVIPQQCYADYEFNYSAASTITVTQIGGGSGVGALPIAQFVTDTGATTETFAAGVWTGAQNCNIRLSGGSSYTATTRTATQMFGDTPGAFVGMTWLTTVTNVNSGVVTIGKGTSVTCADTLTLASSTTRTFLNVFTSVSQSTMFVVGTGTYS